MRYAISYEIIGISISAPVAAWIFNVPVFEMGVVGFVGSTIAVVWVYFYNQIFDRVLVSLTGTALKSLRVRVAHAVLLEIGLILVLLPFIMWYLELDFLSVLVMDAGFSLFYMVYTFGFDLAYDRLFPLKEERAESY